MERNEPAAGVEPAPQPQETKKRAEGQELATTDLLERFVVQYETKIDSLECQLEAERLSRLEAKVEAARLAGMLEEIENCRPWWKFRGT